MAGHGWLAEQSAAADGGPIIWFREFSLSRPPLLSFGVRHQKPFFLGGSHESEAYNGPKRIIVQEVKRSPEN
jgi:hypothetical protein